MVNGCRQLTTTIKQMTVSSSPPPPSSHHQFIQCTFQWALHSSINISHPSAPLTMFVSCANPCPGCSSFYPIPAENMLGIRHGLHYNLTSAILLFCHFFHVVFYFRNKPLLWWISVFCKHIFPSAQSENYLFCMRAPCFGRL